MTANLRAQVERGELPDDGSAAEILHTEIERAFAAHGRTPADIDAMTAYDLSHVHGSFEIATESGALPLAATIKLYLDDIESNIIPRIWDQKKRRLEDFAGWTGQILVTQVDRHLSTRYINEHLKPQCFALNYSKNSVAMNYNYLCWEMYEVAVQIRTIRTIY